MTYVKSGEGDSFKSLTKNERLKNERGIYTICSIAFKMKRKCYDRKQKASNVRADMRISSMLGPFGVRLVAFLLCINDEPDYFNEDIPRRMRARAARRLFGARQEKKEGQFF